MEALSLPVVSRARFFMIHKNENMQKYLNIYQVRHGYTYIM